MTEIHTVIVSLERATDRAKIMQDQIDKYGIKNVHFYPCFDGKNLTNTTYSLKINLQKGYCYRRGEDLTPGDTGCNLSHIGALSMAKTMGWPYVVLLEDDVILAEDYEKRLEYLLKIAPKNWEHIYLSGDPHFDNSMSIAQKEFLKQTMQVLPSVYTNCTFAYMVRDTAYTKLIAKISSLETTTDDLINNFIFTDKGMISYTFFPFPVAGNSEITSNTYVGLKPMKNHPSEVYFKNRMFNS